MQNKVVKLTINTSKGTLQQKDSQILDVGISQSLHNVARGGHQQILISKANTILDDIRSYENKQRHSQVIELQSNFQRAVDDVQSENGFQFFNEVSQDSSQYADMGCPGETSILDEYLGRRESHPETRILQKQYPIVQKKPQFQMPVLFSPESTGSNSATPPVMQQTTPKKQLDFETTQMQLNIQKLENVFDMTHYQQNIKDYLISASEHNILSITDEMPPITTSDERLEMKQSEWLKYTQKDYLRQQEIVGMHYINHYEDQEDEHIVIDLEKEQNESQTFQGLSNNNLSQNQNVENLQSRQVLGEKSINTNNQQIIVKKEQPPKEYINALNNPLITKSSKIASVASIDFENNQNQLVKTDSNILSQFTVPDNTNKRMPCQLFQRLDQKKIMQSQPASVKNAHNNNKAKLLYHTQENIRKRGSQHSALQIVASNESSFIGAPGCGNTTQSQGNKPNREINNLQNMKRLAVSSTGNNSGERINHKKLVGVTSNPSNQKTGRKNNRIDFRTVNTTATKTNEPQGTLQEKLSSFSIGHTPHNHSRMTFNLQQKPQHYPDHHQRINSQSDVPTSLDHAQKHQNNPEDINSLAQIHQLRLKNAEQRSSLAKAAQRTKLLEIANEQLTCDNQRLNRLRESDLKLFKAQETTIQRLQSEQSSYAQVISAQQREIEGMRAMIQRTIEVKIEYEGVIKELLEDITVRELVIDICLKKRQEKEEIEGGNDLSLFGGEQDYAMSPHQIDTVYECSSEMNY